MCDKNGEELKKSGKVMKRKNVEINRKKVSEWFTEKFFGKKMSSWDQLMEYVFGNKNRKEILDAMDTPREMIRRRLDNEC
jgi:ribosomal protein S2